MPAIITNKFRVKAAEQFMEDFSEGDSTNSYYLFYAKSKPWADVKLQLRDATSGLELDFKNNEVVWLDTGTIGARTYATAEGTGKVRYWDYVNKVLYLTDVTGTFVADGSNEVVFNNLSDEPLTGDYPARAATAGWYIDTTGCTIYDDNTSAPAPIDTDSNSFRLWNNMLGMKEILSTDVSHIIPRIDWTTGKKYNQYADNIDLANYPTNTDTDYVDSIYVMNTDYSVYKCISNNGRSASTVEPTSVGTEFITLADGYVWKFMYTISAADVAKFVTDDWIPVRNTTSNPGSGQPYETQWNTYNDATNGELFIRVLDGGTGYVSGDWTSNTDLTISGRGYTIEANTGTDSAITIENGVVTAISIDPVGANYEYAYASLDFSCENTHESPLAPAIIEAIVGPRGGHGTDTVNELGGNYIMISSKLSGSEGAVLSIENDYRVLGIIHNPTINGDVANGSVYDLTIHLTFGVSETNTLSEDEVVQVGNYADANIFGTVVEFNESAVASSCRLTDIICDEDLDSTYGFNPGDIIKDSDDDDSFTIASDGITAPTIDFCSGDILYVEQRRPISRASTQIEDIKLILEF